MMSREEEVRGQMARGVPSLGALLLVSSSPQVFPSLPPSISPFLSYLFSMITPLIFSSPSSRIFVHIFWGYYLKMMEQEHYLMMGLQKILLFVFLKCLSLLLKMKGLLLFVISF